MNKTIYLGSTNPVKINACREVLTLYGYEVIGQDVSSGVLSQPQSDDETKAGALNRALNLTPNSLRIGLEAGVQLHGDILFLVNWGVLIDELDHIYWAGGTRIPLPDEFKDNIINQKQELSDVMKQYFNKINIKHQEGAIGFFTENLVVRIDIFTHIVKLLYGQYLKQIKER